MSIDKWILKENELIKKKISLKEVQKTIKKQKEFIKTKETISIKIKTEDNIYHLKELIEKWIINKQTAENIIKWNNIENSIIKEIFNKIDKIEDIKNIKNYIPDNLRINKNDYLKALNDGSFRNDIIKRLDKSLIILSNKINPDSIFWINLLSWVLTILDKNLILIQENTIDIKNSLVNNNKTLNIFEQIKLFCKNIFK